MVVVKGGVVHVCLQATGASYLLLLGGEFCLAGKAFGFEDRLSFCIWQDKPCVLLVFSLPM